MNYAWDVVFSDGTTKRVDSVMEYLDHVPYGEFEQIETIVKVRL